MSIVCVCVTEFCVRLFFVKFQVLRPYSCTFRILSVLCVFSVYFVIIISYFVSTFLNESMHWSSVTVQRFLLQLTFVATCAHNGQTKKIDQFELSCSTDRTLPIITTSF